METGDEDDDTLMEVEDLPSIKVSDVSAYVPQYIFHIISVFFETPEQ